MQKSLEMVYHIVMCIFALFQVLLTIFAIWICRKHDGAQIKQVNFYVCHFFKLQLCIKQQIFIFLIIQRSFENLIASCNHDDETVAVEIR